MAPVCVTRGIATAGKHLLTEVCFDLVEIRKRYL